MTAMTAGNNGEGTAKGERALRWIGDLDHPFYNDERQRFVWYEASAIAFQLFLLSNMALVGAMLWIGSAGALRYALPLFLLNGLIAIVAIGYAKRNCAEYEPQKSDLTNLRGALVIVLASFLGAGLGRALLDLLDDGPASLGETAGFAAGFLLMALIGVAVALKSGKRQALDEPGEF